MDWKFERVAGPFGVTEGPVWDGAGVLFSDMPNDRIMRFDVDSGSCSVYRDGLAGPNGLKFGPDGDLFVCEMVGRRIVRCERDGIVPVIERYEGHRFNSPNDLAVRDGLLWFTDPYYAADWEPDGKKLELDHRSVYRVDPTDPATLARVTDDTTDPNGILVSQNGETLYVAQSDYDGLLQLRAYPIHNGGSLGEYEILHDFSPERGVDGMCFDRDGNVVATAGWERGGPGPLIYVFDPDGHVLETYPSPDPFPTNCCFGGPNLCSLFVTGRDGCLYRARTDRVGYLGAPE